MGHAYYFIGGPTDGLIIQFDRLLDEIAVPGCDIPGRDEMIANTACHGHPFDHDHLFHLYRADEVKLREMIVMRYIGRCPFIRVGGKGVHGNQ